MTTYTIIRRIVRVLALAGCVYIFIDIGLKMREGAANSEQGETMTLDYTSPLTAEDSSLIPVKYISRFTSYEVHRYKGRNPVTVFTFDNKYTLLLYRIDLRDSVGSDFLSVDEESRRRTSSAWYHEANTPGSLLFQTKVGPVEPCSAVFVTLAGDSQQNLVKNDTVAYYHLLFKNFTLKYSKDQPVDFYMVGSDGFFTPDLIPMDLLLLRRQRALYLSVLVPIKLDDPLPANMLYDMILKRNDR